MRAYDREEVDDYDDYEMEGGYQDEDVEGEEGEEYEEGGEEYEEEEARQPTQEELDYLELRQRLKESIRRKRKLNGANSSQEKDKTSTYNNFGSFFGPSQPVISQRVIQESKALLEDKERLTRLLSQSSKKNSASNSSKPKPGQRVQVPKATSEVRKKVEKLKVARDYSFLSDDAEPPAPAKEPPPRNVSAPTSEARSAQMPLKSKPQLGSNGTGGRAVQGIREERRPVPMNGQMHPKSVSNKSSSASKPSVMSMDSKKQHSGSNGSGPGRPGNGSGAGRPVGASNGIRPPRPVGASNGMGPGRPSGASNGMGPGRPTGASNGMGPGRPTGASNGMGPGRPSGAVPSKMPVAKMEKKISAPAARNLPPTAQKAPPSKIQSSGSRQQLELRKGLQERSRDKIMPQRPMTSSKPQVNKPAKPVSSHSHTTSNVQRPKKKQHLSEDEKALMMIRNMFHTDRYQAYDDDDVSDMEANFDEIMKEEKRSARIARQEDEEELKKIEEEERRERLRKQAKKRKLSHH